ncbi:hypothetical protein [Pueribacillus theae]|uniref:hypothetical protein n=1 Tax=Pueribacillus theae TaxID=2171751 RepID=UPI001402F5C0|nr:hypothetical protein [Pueribacillus theae]
MKTEPPIILDERGILLSNSKKKALGVIAGVGIIIAIMAVKFFIGNSLFSFIKGLIS